MAGGVFVLKDPQTLVAMQPASFATEDDFQRLLAEFPALLAGEQIDQNSPRRWLLLSREKSVPSEDGGSARWFLDHLFVDQDGVPTLVEVKRQSDTRLRREVLGQMLDYAANAVAYWPLDELRDEFEEACAAKGIAPEDEIASRLGFDGNVEALWQRIKTNLAAGRIRMLFVADQIPPELRRIVEFLNKQMDPAEVLALELRQYAGESLKTIVPMVYGQTQEARQKKAAGTPKRQWDEEMIFSELEARQGPEAVHVARQIASWMKANADRVWYGRGTQDGSMGCAVVRDGQECFPLVLWTYGKVEVAFQWIMKSAFKEEAKRRELLRRLNEIDGISFPADVITRRPAIPLPILANEKRLKSFLAAMSWVVHEIKSA